MSTAQQIIGESMKVATFCVQGYLEDLSDEDLLRRPCPNANHIAWQLGHLITSENQMIEMCCPGSMPALPDGFAEKYSKETAGSDDPASFDSKEALFKLMNEQHEGFLAALAKQSDEDFQKESPEAMRQYAPTVGAAFNMVPSHWIMHSGQWVILRRQLGRAPLF